MRIDDDIYAMAVRLGRATMAAKLRLATAESCTGGLIAGAITAVAGSSDWFDRGFVVYSNGAKVDELGVPEALIERCGAVSKEVASAMAQGALRASQADWAVAVTGIAGPAGGTPAKPVGTVCFAWSGPPGVESELRLLPGDRAEVRRESVAIALQGLLDRLA